MRFFLENNEREIKAGVCVEGVRLGRLSFASIGMLRGEISCSVPEEYDWSRFGASGAIVTLNDVINKISAIPLPRRPRSSVVFGSVRGGTSYSTIPSNALLRFEIRSESSEQVSDISQRIEDIADEVRSDTGAEVKVDIFARREPGGITFSHPLARCCRDIMKALGLEPRVAPSTSELAALIDHAVPAVTVGLTRGQSIDKPGESIEIEPTFTGLAQLLGILLAIDGEDCHEH
jgi:metal-dependent amidase/aminoacylase/carboxypeptidase family protein